MNKIDMRRQEFAAETQPVPMIIRVEEERKSVGTEAILRSKGQFFLCPKWCRVLSCIGNKCLRGLESNFLSLIRSEGSTIYLYKIIKTKIISRLADRNRKLEYYPTPPAF